MHVGTIFSQADSGHDAEAIRQWAITADEAGFHHILAYDHVLGATVERLTGGAIGQFGTPPYTDQSTFHEILTLFSHLAGVTERIEFATSVLVLPQRQTAVAVKQIATVDRLSGGRLNVAVGVGWNHAEYEALGVDFADRTAILEEQIDLMRMLLTQPLVTFEGRFHRLDQVGINPLPGRPIPIWIGTGGADSVLRRVVRCGDGWMPLLLPGVDRHEVGERVLRLRRLCEEAGRDPGSLPVWGRIYLDGTDSWKPRAEQAAALGFTHLSVGFDRFAHPPTPHAQHLELVMSVIDEVRSIVSGV
jgi:probable F420-dependent oxidoreductase